MFICDDLCTIIKDYTDNNWIYNCDHFYIPIQKEYIINIKYLFKKNDICKFYSSKYQNFLMNYINNNRYIINSLLDTFWNFGESEILNILIPLDFITVISLFLDRMPRVSIVARRVAIGDI